MVLNEYPSHFITEIDETMEIGAISACGKTFTTAVIRACHFHIGQAWFRKSQQIGLSKAYQS